MVTQDIYLAKSKSYIAEQTAAKVAAKLTAAEHPLHQNSIQENSWMKFLSVPTQQIFQAWRGH